MPLPKDRNGSVKEPFVALPALVDDEVDPLAVLIEGVVVTYMRPLDEVEFFPIPSDVLF